MRLSPLRLVGPLAAGLLLAGPLAFAQQTPASPPAPATTLPAEVPAAPASPAMAGRVGPLFKLGTGVINGTGWSGFGGLTLPLVLGVEQQLAPGWSATLNGSSLWNFSRPRDFGLNSRKGLSLEQLGVNAGVRHYYHQAKRQAAGRRTGPYQGPYVALQLNNYFDRRFFYNSNRSDLTYAFSSLTALWGVQRRLGRHGLLDAYAGGGLSNPRFFRYNGGPQPDYQRKLGLSLELGVKISLVNR